MAGGEAMAGVTTREAIVVMGMLVGMAMGEGMMRAMVPRAAMVHMETTVAMELQPMVGIAKAWLWCP